MPSQNIINYRTESVKQYVDRITDGKGFDIIFDTVGADNLPTSLAALAVYGTVVTIQANVTLDLSPLHSKAGNLSVVLMLLPILLNQKREHHGKILAELAKMVDEGLISPLIYPKTFKFKEIEAAHAFAETGQAYGKIVIENA